MKKKKKDFLKLFLILLIIGALIYLAYFICNAFKEVNNINNDIGEYNNMILENISELSESQINHINKINGSN